MISGNKGKVWILSEVFHPEETSTGHILTRIGTSLASRFTLSVICARPTYSLRGARVSKTETYRDMTIRRVWSTTFDKNIVPLRLLNHATFGIGTLVRALIEFRKHDVVVVVTNPPILPFLAALVCMLRGATMVLLVHDVYPEVLVAAGYGRPSSPVIRLIQLATRWLYRQSQAIVVLSEDMKSLVRSKVGSDSPRVCVIPNWADLDLIDSKPRENSQLLDSLGLTEKFVVQFAGNIGRVQNIPNIVDGITELETDPAIHFLFVGNGGMLAYLAMEVERRGLSNVTLLDPVPRNQAAMIHQACDLALLALSPGMSGVSAPSRLYNILASGRPILANVESESEVGTLVTSESLGWVVEPSDVDGFVNAVRSASSEREACAHMGARARDIAEQRFAPDAILDEWTKLLSRV